MVTRTSGIQLSKSLLAWPVRTTLFESSYRIKHTLYSTTNFSGRRQFLHHSTHQFFNSRCCYHAPAATSVNDTPRAENSYPFDQYASSIIKKNWDSAKDTTVSLQNFLDAMYVEKASLSPEVTQQMQQFWVPYMEDLSVDRYADYPKISDSLACLLVQYYCVKLNLERAAEVFTNCSRLGNCLNGFSCNLLAFYTLQQQQSVSHLKTFSTILLTMSQCNYKFTLSHQMIDRWLGAALKAKDVDLLSEFVYHFTDIASLPARKSTSKVFRFALTYQELQQISLLCVQGGKFALFSKIVGFTLKKMRSDSVPSARINEYRSNMTLSRFNAYVKMLGASKVILNGTFNTFGFAGGKHHCKASDFPLLVHSLGKEHPNLKYDTALHLIEQMCGYHIREYLGRYSPVLHPLEQKSRIYKAAVGSKAADEEIQSEYSNLIRLLCGNGASRIGKPARMSSKYRNRASVSRHAVFGVLPLNIILNVIGSTNGDLRVALKLVKSMINNHRCSIDNETIVYLTRVFRKNAKSGGPLLPSVIQAFKKDLVLNRQLYLSVLDVLIECDGRMDDIYKYLNGYVHCGYLVSGYLYERVKEVMEKQNDKRYMEFKPVLDIFNEG